jgi:uncharacterized protein
MRGLLGRSGLEPGEGMLFEPAGSIHMFFMRFAIDAIFVDRDGTVLKIAANLKPWRMAWARRGHAVIELAAGEVARRGIAPGDRIEQAK